MARAGRLVAFSLMLACSAPSIARGQDQGKKPPPPLFPRHRRGVYRNTQGLEVVSAAPQSPPLEIDDPGVPDKGEYEINLTTHADLAKDSERVDLLLVDANYGLQPTIAGHELPTQVKFEFPVAAARESGNPFTVGIGAATFGLKFNFYNDEHRGVALSFYPQLEFGTPGAHGVEKGLDEPGQTVILPLLVLKEFSNVIFVANGAFNAPVHDPERDITGTVGVGLGRAVTRKVALMMELRGESTFDLKRDRVALLNAGLIRGVRNIVVYGKVGRSMFSDDGSAHTYLSVGMKALIHTKDRKPG
jgi:hypothetical protein